MKELVNLVLQGLIKINQNVSTKNSVKFIKRAIGCEVMLREDDIFS